MCALGRWLAGCLFHGRIVAQPTLPPHPHMSAQPSREDWRAEPAAQEYLTRLRDLGQDRPGFIVP